MRFGCETIIFGPRLDDLEHTLATLARLGFSGVEFSQQPGAIYVYAPATDSHHPASIEEIASGLKRHGLTFLGLAGGSIRDRVDFCSKADPERLARFGVAADECRPLYLYLEDPTDPQIAYALEHGFRLACHPHAFSRFDRVEAARAVMEKAPPDVMWMPDTAHMSVTGEDPAETLRSLPIERIAAVHLKDYDASYGRSYHRYAKGFVPLGEGDVPLDESLAVLKERRFDGWVVVEQDYSATEPIDCLARSARWLQKRGYMSPRLDAESVDERHRLPDAGEFEGTGLNRAEFSRMMFRAGDAPLAACYQSIAAALYLLFDACHVAIWACSNARDDVFLLTAYPPELQTESEPFRLSKRESALGSVVAPMQVREFDVEALVKGGEGKRFQWRGVAEATGATSAIAMAIPNRYNPHVVRMIVGIMRNKPNRLDYHGIVDASAADIARAADSALDDACSLVANRVNILADETSTLEGFLKELEVLIRQAVGCEALTIFLTNRSGERLDAHWSTNGRCLWNPALPKGEQCYRRHETTHPTVQCWTQFRTVLMSEAGQIESREGGASKSQEDVPEGSVNQDNILAVPLVSVSMTETGRQQTSALGVIRCRNKQPAMLNGGAVVHPYFTDDDAAILSSICQAAAPHIEVLRRDEWLIRSLAHLTHELNMPVNTLQAALDELQTLLHDAKEPEVQDLVEDMLSWTGLMSRVVGAADIFGRKADRLPMECKPTLLMGDVIAPLKPQLRFLLANRGFDVGRIVYSDFRNIPRLWIDRNLFQMVFFNLLSNAIKYAFNDPKRFRIRIETGYNNGYYMISCSDDGPGIDDKFLATIFEEGVRGPESLNRIVKGMGIGLWIVRRVVEAHGGRVEVTSSYNPTTFTIYLPESLRSSAPKQQEVGSHGG